MRKLLSEKELSEEYGFQMRTLQRHRREQRGIPYVRHAGRILYRHEDVEQYLKENTVEFSEGNRS